MLIYNIACTVFLMAAAVALLGWYRNSRVTSPRTPTDHRYNKSLFVLGLLIDLTMGLSLFVRTNGPNGLIIVCFLAVGSMLYRVIHLSKKRKAEAARTRA